MINAIEKCKQNVFEITRLLKNYNCDVLQMDNINDDASKPLFDLKIIELQTNWKKTQDTYLTHMSYNDFKSDNFNVISDDLSQELQK